MNTATDLDYARYDHIRPILWTGDALQLLDQRKLPFVVEHVVCRDSDEVAAAIHALTVRGAPVRRPDAPDNSADGHWIHSGPRGAPCACCLARPQPLPAPGAPGTRHGSRA
jgi:hypothetical protein